MRVGPITPITPASAPSRYEAVTNVNGASVGSWCSLPIVIVRPWPNRELLREALSTRLGQGLTITIGSEHQDPTLAPFTLVTASYRLGALAGVIGPEGRGSPAHFGLRS